MKLHTLLFGFSKFIKETFRNWNADLTEVVCLNLQITAETAFDMVSPGPSYRKLREISYGKHSRKRLHPPKDIREGVTNALTIVREVNSHV